MADPTTEGMRKAFADAAARQGAPARPAEESVQVLSFALADEWYGLPLADLVEILGGVEPTPIPYTPPYIPGVINHRGTIVAVVDLKRIFGLPSRFRRETGRIILVRSGDTSVGLEADALSDIVTVATSQVEPPLSTIEKVKSAYITGCVRRPRGLLVLLSVDALIGALEAGTLA